MTRTQRYRLGRATWVTQEQEVTTEVAHNQTSCAKHTGRLQSEPTGATLRALGITNVAHALREHVLDLRKLVERLGLDRLKNAKKFFSRYPM